MACRYALFIALFAIAAEAKHNILFFLADDMGYYDLGSSDFSVQTPNIDNLKDSGVHFKWSYAQAECTPSRASLMTGYYPWRTGLQNDVIFTYQGKALPTKFTTVATSLQNLGYKTYLFGKWHLGASAWEHHPMSRGFDEHIGFLGGQQGYYNHMPYDDWTYDEHGTQHNWEPEWDNSYDYRDNLRIDRSADGKYGPDHLNARVMNIIDENAENFTETPFFMMYSLQNPHLPNEPKHEDLARYGDITNSTRLKYKALVTNMDDIVGDIVLKLKEKNLYENTVIIFSNDNGGQMVSGSCNYPLRGYKGTNVLEGANRVQTFVHGAMLQNTGVTIEDGFFHVVDWYPTLVEGVAHGSIDSFNGDGINQWESIVQGCNFTRDSFIYDWQFGGSHSAIRVGDYKLMYYDDNLDTNNLEWGIYCDNKPNDTTALRLKKNLSLLVLQSDDELGGTDMDNDTLETVSDAFDGSIASLYDAVGVEYNYNNYKPIGKSEKQATKARNEAKLKATRAKLTKMMKDKKLSSKKHSRTNRLSIDDDENSSEDGSDTVTYTNTPYLYKISEDETELTDLASSYPQIVKQLKSTLIKYVTGKTVLPQDYDDTATYSGAEYFEGMYIPGWECSVSGTIDDTEDNLSDS